MKRKYKDLKSAQNLRNIYHCIKKKKTVKTYIKLNFLVKLMHIIIHIVS